LLVTVLGCSSQGDSERARFDPNKSMAWGSVQEISVFADDAVWKFAETPLRSSLERYYYTTYNETYFDVERVGFDKIEQFYKFNNLIFFADMESDQDISRYVKNLLGESIKVEIEENAVALIPKNNLWANGQFVIFMVGSNEENLLKLNILQADRIFDLFKEKLYEKISDRIYKQVKHNDRFYEPFPWKLDLTKNYIIYKREPENNFVSYLARLREHPDRYLSVYYEKIDRADLSKEWLFAKRRELAWKYYDEDEVDETDIRFENYDFNGFEGWKMAGRWQNLKYSVGGAFQSFAFYHDSTSTAYIVDNSVYFPEGYKLSALIELEIISRTLRIDSLEDK
jgi:hypothetical protein